MQEYALYKRDEFLCVGTVQEIARMRGITVRAVRYYRTPSYQRRCKGTNANHNRMILVPLDEEDEA